MQSAGIGPGSDDRQVRETAMVANEFVGQFGFNIRLVQARFQTSQDTVESLTGDFAGLAYGVDLGFGFYNPQCVEQTRNAMVLMKRIFALALRNEPGIAGFDLNFGAFMLILFEIDVLAVAHQAMEKRWKLAQPLNILDAGNLSGFLLGQLMAFPDLGVRGGLAQKKNFALVFIRGIGIENENTLLLGDACQVK